MRVPVGRASDNKWASGSGWTRCPDESEALGRTEGEEP